ncbi:MAG TPA: hypothetical protein VMW27_05500 [Thermoanaerobaculia bacterium]|nr:hypothetical protein [Thermoanaerobaculia bacterium]
MKKLDKKLRLDRETLCRLNPREVSTADLANARGGNRLADNVGIDWTGCMSECTEC